MIKKFIKYCDKTFLNYFLYKLYILYLGKLLKKKVSKNFEHNYQFFFKKKTTELAMLFVFYCFFKDYSDLSKRFFYKNWHPHTYGDFYSNLFDHCKLDIKKVFECGIGTDNENIPSNMGKGYKPGSSLRVWKSNFKNAKIYGADVDKGVLFEEDRIKTFYVNQLEQRSIKAMWTQINENNFDLIIDDGLHTFEAGVSLLENSFDKLRPGGIYIIEDVDISYLNKLALHLEKNFNISIVIFPAINKKIQNDNNLIIIRKN